MPCNFSGIFYVTRIDNNKLIWEVSDESGDLDNIEISYYFPANILRPFREPFETVRPGNVYFIVGTFALKGNTPFVSTFERLSLTVCS
jgi:hypothetical protein